MAEGTSSVLKKYFKVSSICIGDTFFLLRSSLLLLFFAVLFHISTSAQFLDSLNFALHAKPELTGSIISRSSFITSNLARIEGYRVGISFDDRLEFGIAYNRLKTPIILKRAVVNNKNEALLGDAQLKLNYISIYSEYIFYKNRKWVLTAPLLIGYGHAKLIASGTGENLVNNEVSGCFIYEPYLTAEYLLIRYLSLEAGVGYRIGTIQNNLGFSINSPMYIFVLNVYYYTLYKDIRAKIIKS